PPRRRRLWRGGHDEGPGGVEPARQVRARLGAAARELARGLSRRARLRAAPRLEPPRERDDGAGEASGGPLPRPAYLRTTRSTRATVPTRNEKVAACTPPSVFPRRELTGACIPTRQPAPTPTSTARPRLTPAPAPARSLRLQPGIPHADVDGQRRIAVPYAAHLALHQLARLLHLGRGTLEQQLVVDREDQPRGEPVARERVLAADHCELEDVGGGALDDGVDGQAFAKRPHLVVASLELGDLAAPVPERLHVALLAGARDRVLDERGHAREALEVGVDELLCVLARDVEAVGEAVVGEPVDDAEVDHLGLRAHAVVDGIGRY